MIILYTDKKGGHWIPFNTPLSQEAIMAHLDDDPQVGFFEDGAGQQYGHQFDPPDDSLPHFFSILLPTNKRWDACNQCWCAFLCGTTFVAYWNRYIANYKPLEPDEEREYWWRDPGHYVIGSDPITGLL